MKKLGIVLAVLVLALTTALTGCKKASSDSGPVLAKVNQNAITAADFRKQVEELAPQMQQAVIGDPKARKEFLEDLIGIELVIQEAKRQKLDQEADYKKRHEQLRKDLERRIQEEAKNDLFNSVLKKELGDKMNKVVPPTDKEVREYYDKNRDKINKAAGRDIKFKDIEQQIKMRMLQEKRRDIYLEYAKGLKAKAAISVDDKALDTAIAEMSKPAELSGLTVTKMPAPGKEAAK